MAELTLAYRVNTHSSGVHGRAICNARTNHFIADDAGGEAPGAGELFLSGITACAVNMVQRVAKNEAIPVAWMDVSVESYRDPGKPQGDLTVFDDIRVHFQIWGVDDDQGQHLVNVWKQR
jgi:uncharacterized OsmC-like protein